MLDTLASLDRQRGGSGENVDEEEIEWLGEEESFSEENSEEERF